MTEPAGGDARAALANDFGLLEAVIGFVGGYLLDAIAIPIYLSADHLRTSSGSFGAVLVGLVALWVGFVGAAIVAVRRQRADPRSARAGRATLRDDLGFALRPWPDIPLGVVVGVACQYLLVPVAELPLLPFVPHLFHRLGNPAHSLTADVHGPGLVVLGLFVCLGSPVVEELYFRGVILRGLLGRARGLPVLGVAAPMVATGLLFGLAHFEALQFLGLAAFGVVLCVLAYRTRRLGPGIVAHVAFNATTFVALAQIQIH